MAVDSVSPESIPPFPPTGESPYSPNFDDTELIQKLLDVKTGLAVGGDLVVFKIAGDDTLSDSARASESRNFAEGYIAENGTAPDPDEVREELEEHYVPYDRSSTFLYLLDTASAEPMGTVRIIQGSEDPDTLKTLKDLPAHWGVEGEEVTAHYGIDTASTWDVASLVVEHAYRGTLTGPLLNNVLYKQAMADPDVRSWTTILITPYFNSLTRSGIPFQRIFDLPDAIHMGEMSAPAIIPDKDDIKSSMINGTRMTQKMFKLLGEGEGLDYEVVDLT